MKPTLKDIAEKTNLSITSVSLVINQRPNKLSKESRERILKAAQELNYQPTQKRRRQKCRSGKLLGLIVPSVCNSFFAEIVQGMDDCAQENGWQILLATSDDDPEKEAQTLRVLENQRISGLVIASAASYDSTTFSPPFHVVQVDRQSPRLEYSAVILNHKKGAYLATKHLLDLGHTRIACVTGPQKHESARQRLDGFFWAYEDAGIPCQAEQIFESDYTSSGGYEVAKEILDGDFTAVFLGNDMMALGLYQRMGELGKKIPQDLSVVGFDDIDCAGLLDVPLTTVHQSGHDLGYAACQRLLTEMEDPEISKQAIYFEPRLVVRRSTAPL